MASAFQVTPSYWSPTGQAVAVNKHGKPLDIWQGIPQETALVRLQHTGENRSAAYYVDAPTQSPHRVSPPCDKYVACGGCPLMHVTPDGQWQARQSLVRRALDAVQLQAIPIGQTIDGQSKDSNYRHVIQVHAGYSDHKHIRLGAFGRRSRRVVPIPECQATTPALRHLMKTLAYHVIELDIHPWNPQTGHGIFRTAVARASHSTGDILVTLVVGRRTRELQRLAERLCTENPDVVGVWLHINDQPGNAVFVRDHRGAVGVRHLVGRATITETLGGIHYTLGPGDFFQTNPFVAEPLCQRVLERMQLAAGDAVVDLYCGVGVLALQAARVTGWALGVDEVEGAVMRAREAATRNHLSAEFVPEIVVHALPDIAKRVQAPMVLVNPSRSGLEPGVVEGIAALSPRRIGYVSCNPKSLARDLRQLVDLGFKPGAVDLFNMFPNTAHVECLVVLEGKQPTGATPRAPMRKRVRRR